MRALAATAATAALLIGQSPTAFATEPADGPSGEGEDQAVCTLALSSTFEPGLRLAPATRAVYRSKGAITCVGLISGTTGQVLAGEYTSQGVYRGDCLFGTGEETFTAVFTNSDGTQRTLVETHAISTAMPIGVAKGEHSGALLEFVLSGDCRREAAKSAVVAGQLTMPAL